MISFFSSFRIAATSRLMLRKLFVIFVVFDPFVVFAVAPSFPASSCFSDIVRAIAPSTGDTDGGGALR